MRAKTATLTQVRLKELFKYYPETGEFERIKRINGAKFGKKTKGVDSGNGYKAITLDYVAHCAHRLAWLYMTGETPGQLDHINGDRSDNRFANLRICSNSQNAANKKRPVNNSTGYKGVFVDNGKFRAAIKVNGKRIYLGYHASAEDAHAAYVKAASEIFGEFARAE